MHHDDEARGWYKLAIARDPLDARAQQALYELNLASQNTARSTRPGPLTIHREVRRLAPTIEAVFQRVRTASRVRHFGLATHDEPCPITVS